MSDLASLRRIEAAKRRTLITPEGVDLSLKLADIGQRVGAFLLDGLIMFAALFGLTLLAFAAIAAIGLERAEIVGVIWLLGFFILRNGYFILMEMSPRAATFGKRASGLRVVARSGERLTADRVIARNLMREIEFYLPLSFLSYNASQGAGSALMSLAGLGWTGLFLFFPMFNKDKMRVGDLLAGTWVISAPRKKLEVDLLDTEAPAAPRYTFTEAQLDVYGVYELQTLERVLREANPEALGTVAHVIRNKIGLGDQYGDEHEFLLCYYDAIRARMERGLLFGKRRADKFDKGT
ncbi:MAG: RDD family protein [Sphingomonadaceae bacterium]|nr:RDD family protein [Sphingomonadaceae bacterium]